jgi:polyisoprenyl-phosphate glycosyltransferase
MKNPLNRPQTVGVVIPAYNEAENLSPVLDAVCAAEWLTEIVIVDDGSTDATLEVAQYVAERDHRLAVIGLPENRGKAAAMLTGVRALHTDLVIFLDADLVGLTPFHLQELQSLQKSGSREMTIAVFQIGRTFINVSQRIVPHLSGQRCLWRLEAEEALIPLVADRYGAETGLTIHARRHQWKIRKILWRGVTHHMIYQKGPVIAGLHNRWQMYSQIMTVIARNGYGRRRGARRFRIIDKDRLTLR